MPRVLKSSSKVFLIQNYAVISVITGCQKPFASDLTTAFAKLKSVVIYGDSFYEDTARNLSEHLQNRLSEPVGGKSLGTLRTLLIQAGQLEQAVQDEHDGTRFTCVTDALARAFFQAWCEDRQTRIEVPSIMEVISDNTSDTHITVKIPEGFAFYALFPEQYILSAQKWASRQHEITSVLIVGVRSIGTGLSALVGATLEHQGWKVQRLTVRPSGPPFERNTQIEPSDLSIEPSSTYALVVDEGPGLSGSSMASIGEALVRAGVNRSHIAFLPGHGGSPGHLGSEDVREWWATTPRFTAATSEVRWDGQTLSQKLAARTAEILSEPVDRVEDVGGGLWRHFVYARVEDFPSVAPAFEPPKFLCFSQSGRAILWKFGGLAVLQNGETGAEHMMREANARAQYSWTPPALAIESGFVATTWIGGKVLLPNEVTPEFLVHVGRYLGASAKEPLSTADQKRSLERMGEWLYWNTWEALGETFAERTRVRQRQVVETGSESLYPTYGDGRMAPSEWRLNDVGHYMKLDCCGHDVDHTVVGQQTLAWDVAGMIIEWSLNSDQTKILLRTLKTVSAVEFPADFLCFHLLGYAAFRLGLLMMEGGGSGVDFYRAALERWID